MTPTLQQSILDKLNGIRNQIALGQTPNYAGAVKMATMYWDPNLATYAELSVRGCWEAPDSCRNTKDWSRAGLSMLMVLTTSPVTDDQTNFWVTYMINNFYNQKDNGVYYNWMDGITGNYTRSSAQNGHPINDFTIMVTDITQAVGVGVSTFDYPYSGTTYYGVQLTIAYAMQNIDGRPTYVAGAPASQCSCTNPQYPGLCCTTEKYQLNGQDYPQSTSSTPPPTTTPPNNMNYCDNTSTKCPSGTTHVACNSPTANGQFGTDCKNPTNKDMTPYKQIITDTHNGLRAKLANGTTLQYTSAQDMATMTWDDDLANFAGQTARTCKNMFDQCRNTAKWTHAGQNLVWVCTNGIITDDSIGKTMTNVITNWFNGDAANGQYYNWMDAIYGNYTQNSQQSGKSINNFLMMGSSVNQAVGCAAVTFDTQLNNASYNCLEIVCNYAVDGGTNKPTYTPGPTAGKCTTTNSQFPSLCGSSQKYQLNGVDYPATQNTTSGGGTTGGGSTGGGTTGGSTSGLDSWTNADLCNNTITRCGLQEPYRHIACNNNGSFSLTCRSPQNVPIVDAEVIQVILRPAKWNTTNATTHKWYWSGQNIAMGRSFSAFDTSVAGLKKLVVDLSNLWWNEYQNGIYYGWMDAINGNYTQNADQATHVIGHFTGMTQDICQAIGCGMSTYTDTYNNQDIQVALFTCNYAMINLGGRPTWESGPTASKCSCINPNYQGLCCNTQAYELSPGEPYPAVV